MKKIFLLLLFLCMDTVLAQRVSIDKIDKFTNDKVFKVDVSKGKYWKTSDKISKGLYNNIFLSTKLISDKKEILVLSNFNFQIGSIICRNPNKGKIIILFNDDNKLILKQASDIKCDNNLNIEYYLGENLTEIIKNLSILSIKEINSFRIYFNDGYRDFSIKENKKQMIIEHYKLILNRLKSIKNIRINVQN